MSLFRSMLLALNLVCILSAAAIYAEDARPKQPPNPFFAFGNGTGGMNVPFDRQAKMLKELGYDGIAHNGIQRTGEMLKALDAQGLKMLSVYVGVSVVPGQPPYPAELKTTIEQLKGRGVQIWLTVGGDVPATAESDARAVAVFREIAGMADRAGLKAALYPHFGSYVATIDDALRLVKKTDRKNVGLCFNLCHFLKSENQEKLTETLKAALPHLLAVNINGADGGPTNAMDWNRLIQPLDRGSFDVGGLLKSLRQLGYSGPIGLQCFAIPGDSRENLARSMAAWRKISAQADR